MFAPVTVLRGSTSVSVHALAAKPSVSTATATAALRPMNFMVVSMVRFRRGLERDVRAEEERARPRVQAVVYAVQACERIDVAVLGHREDVLHGAEETHLLTRLERVERVAERQVLHAQERRVLDVVVREVLLLLEAG